MNAEKARENSIQKSEATKLALYRDCSENYKWAIGHVEQKISEGQRKVLFSMNKLRFGTIQRLIIDGYCIEDDPNTIGNIIVSW